MRQAQTKAPFLKRISSSVVLLGLLFGVTAPLVSAQTRPIFKVFGADVMSGGWFDIDDDEGNNCAGGNHKLYQDPDLQPTGVAQTGGIAAHTKTSGGRPAGGSSSQFGALSLGSIDGTLNVPRTPNGFYSSGATGSSQLANRLSFANDDMSLAFGGNLQGSVRQGHCIPDYFTANEPGATPFILGTDLTASRGGKFTYNAGGNPTPIVINSGPDTISSGTRLTIFVKGNVYIGADIVYDPASTVTSVPKFALVVQGSIYISPDVTQLDGLYIAQPDPADPTPKTSDTGIIWTCHPNNAAAVPDTYPNTAPCTNRLVVNGALIAKQVNFLRINGDVGASTIAEDVLANALLPGSNIAEIINYTPAMVVGGPFFDPPPPSSLKIRSLTNLPPVF